MASTAVGLAGCSSPDRAREPAGAAHPLGTAAGENGQNVKNGQGQDGQNSKQGKKNQPARGDQIPPLAVAANVPGAHPAAGSAADAAADTAAGKQLPAARPNPDGGLEGLGLTGTTVAPASGAAVPSGTTSLPDHQAGGRSALPRRGSPGKGQAAPAPASPAPAPPQNTGSGSSDSSLAQIMDAVVASRMDGKEVLLEIAGDGCADCRALDQAMHSPKAQAVLAQSYHVVRIDPGGAGAIASQYGLSGLSGGSGGSASSGMPTLVVLNPDGTVRADSSRTGRPAFTEAGLSSWLKQWAPR
ncbi:thioredoxin family protein [Catenulispora yoronensis]|uniref:thioredoxin family protein n=1 Tax=Catenulispora yoronensis TaxID=450799 RepID=UPI0031DCFED7